MNYIKHLAVFFDNISADKDIMPTHISLYMTLFRLWNLNQFHNPISVSREKAMCYSKIASASTYHKCILYLQQQGYIKYQPSYNPYKGSLIYITELTQTASKNQQAESPFQKKTKTAKDKSLQNLMHMNSINEDPTQSTHQNMILPASSKNEQQPVQTPIQQPVPLPVQKKMGVTKKQPVQKTTQVTTTNDELLHPNKLLQNTKAHLNDNTPAIQENTTLQENTNHQTNDALVQSPLQNPMQPTHSNNEHLPPPIPKKTKKITTKNQPVQNLVPITCPEEQQVQSKEIVQNADLLPNGNTPAMHTGTTLQENENHQTNNEPVQPPLQDLIPATHSNNEQPPQTTTTQSTCTINDPFKNNINYINTLDNSNLILFERVVEKNQKENSPINLKKGKKISKEKEKSCAKKEKENTGATAKKWQPPTFEQVQAYFAEKGQPVIEAQRFHNHYQANGWLVSGKTPMKDWQAAVRNWILNEQRFNTPKNDKPQPRHLQTSQHKNYSEPL